MDLISRGVALVPIQLHGRSAGQAPLHAADDGGHHPQVS